MHTHNNNNIQQTQSTQHTTFNVHTKGSHAPCRWLSGSWHTRVLHRRQRSVQMRLEGVTSFACPIDADDRGAHEQSLRGFSSSTHVSHFVFGTTLHLLRFFGGTWRIGSSSLRPDYPKDCAIMTVNSCVQPRIPQHQETGHASHDVQVTAESCCATTCIFFIWCVQKQMQQPSSVDTTVPSASRCEYVPDGTCAGSYLLGQLCRTE